MQEQTVRKLLDINDLFYQNFAGAFSQTRRRLQPGVRRLLAEIALEENVVDLGCGNGELAVALASRGQSGGYLGLDSSAGLLEEAQAALASVAGFGMRAEFRKMDLAQPGQLLQITQPSQPVTVTALFAVLHHLPGEFLRLELLHQVRAVLAASPDEKKNHPPRLYLSVWQFLNSPRLTARCQPWERVGMAADQVDPGDYLLDWRAGGSGLRYVHHFTEGELEGLAHAAGFQVARTFLADGEGDQLGLYQVWQPQR